MIKETLAVIRRPRFGMYDGMGPYLAFDSYVDKSSAALQVLDLGQTVELIRATGVSDVAELDGKTVWVDTGTVGIIKYLRATGI